jgi:hypothetical protein
MDMIYGIIAFSLEYSWVPGGIITWRDITLREQNNICIFSALIKELVAEEAQEEKKVESHAHQSGQISGI